MHKETEHGPELGDFSREELAVREFMQEQREIFDVSNELERRSFVDPIEALKWLKSKLLG